MNWERFERPSRYINREINALYKSGRVRVALAFPDIYDVGMSHLGLRILYTIVNSMPCASAERVFSPWVDVEAALKAQGTFLRSIETNLPLREFDIVGFSLQYELSYTTVLNMLSLGGIPLRSAERGNQAPLVIAGGPCTVNPLPMSAFIDAFLVGDGEAAVKEMVEMYDQWKTSGDGRRDSLLRGLSRVEGVYVPGVHGRHPSAYSVKRRFVTALDEAPYPEAPVVPYTQVVHDRITVEISRGCTQGCRFCQAGMVYRPLRQRSPERILEIVDASLKNTGYEEVSLTSLSAGDYPHLLPLVKELNRRLSSKVVSLSLPSLRVGAVDRDILREIKKVRKTGFTIAPEAATERLRGVINKDFTGEDYDRALHTLFTEGWENIKLYFMIGLPTERDEDVEAIPEMALKAIKTAKKFTRRFVNVSVGISPFVPKPHTPFQWCGQEGSDTVSEKMHFLKRHLSQKKMTFKGHNIEMSLLEAVFSRGDEHLSDLIEQAWLHGCRLDAWTERFDFAKWRAAAEKAGIDIQRYAQRKYEETDPLPWEGIDVGIKKDFLWKEMEKSLSCEKTSDCSAVCHACGLVCAGEAGRGIPVRATTRGPASEQMRVTPARSPGRKPFRVRVRFSKTGVMRYLSHRELMTAFIRALRRADVPISYSQGFHPNPRLSFGPPLPVGVSGLREYVDIEVGELRGLPDIKTIINGQLPEGLLVADIVLIATDEPSLDSFISRYEYEIICPDTRPVEGFLAKGAVVIEREKGNGERDLVDVRRAVQEVEIFDPARVRLVAEDLGDAKVRLSELLAQVFQAPIEDLTVTRVAMYGWRDGWVDPFAPVQERRRQIPV